MTIRPDEAVAIAAAVGSLFAQSTVDAAANREEERGCWPRVDQPRSWVEFARAEAVTPGLDDV